MRARAAPFGLVARQADNNEVLEQIKPLPERREKANEELDDDLNARDFPTYFSDGTLDFKGRRPVLPKGSRTSRFA